MTFAIYRIIDENSNKWDFSNYSFLRDCFPVYNTVNKKWQKEQGEMFYRETLDGELKFIKDDYDWFRDLVDSKFACQNHVLVLTRECDDEVYFTGAFTNRDIKFDEDRCVCTLTTKPFDDYACFYEGWEREFNVATLGVTTLQIDLDSTEVVVNSICTDLQAIPYQEQYTIEGFFIEDPVENPDLRWPFYQWCYSTPCGVGKNIHTYKKQVVPFPYDGFTKESAGVYSKASCDTQTPLWEFSRFSTFASVINALLVEIDCTLTYESAFLQSAVNPVDQEDPNSMNWYITQISNMAINSDGVEPLNAATRAPPYYERPLTRYKSL